MTCQYALVVELLHDLLAKGLHLLERVLNTVAAKDKRTEMRDSCIPVPAHLFTDFIGRADEIEILDGRQIDVLERRFFERQQVMV